MIRRSLEAIREKLRAEMESGAELCWRDVLDRADDASKAWAHDTLRNWHRAGEIHVVRWARGRQGPAMPVYRWGAGEDAPKLPPLSSSEKSSRWRAAHPDQVARARKRTVFKRRKSPFLDPIHAAMLGYFRRGGGWSRRPVVIASSPDDHPAHPVPEV